MMRQHGSFPHYHVVLFILLLSIYTVGRCGGSAPARKPNNDEDYAAEAILKLTTTSIPPKQAGVKPEPTNTKTVPSLSTSSQPPTTVSTTTSASLPATASSTTEPKSSTLSQAPITTVAPPTTLTSTILQQTTALPNATGADIKPFNNDKFGPQLSNKHIQGCQHKKYGNRTHEVYKAFSSDQLFLPLADTKAVIVELAQSYWSKKEVLGHLTVVNNPLRTVSVLEPGGPGGCAKHVLETVAQTARQKNCIFASNAGFFNTHNGSCLGNVVVDGREIQNNGGIQNVHFGIKKDGTLFFGYLSEEEVLEEHFEHLVGGVVWLVRNGESYVNASIFSECSKTEETGTLKQFADVEAGRVAVGHDREGRLVIVQIDGETWKRGVSLWEFAQLLISNGVVNAINFDGGGSASIVANGSLLNIPTDQCPNESKIFRCARKVSTVLCIHEPECHPSTNCSGHGKCVLGECQCEKNWAGQACEQLQCGKNNCSGNGKCTEDGCVCLAGFTGENCSAQCPPEKYGYECRGQCRCAKGSTCDFKHGTCDCPPGFIGTLCDKPCPYGQYGKNCSQECYCPKACSCHHVDGKCNSSFANTYAMQAGHCLAKHMIHEQNLVVNQPKQYQMWLVSIIILSVVAAISIIINISLICMSCTCQCSSDPHKYKPMKSEDQQFVIDTDSGSELEIMNLSNRPIKYSSLGKLGR